MKNKLIGIFIFLTIICTTFPKVNAKEAETSYHFTLERQIVLPNNKNGCYINKQTYIAYGEKTIDIYTSNNKLTLKDNYVCHAFYNNNVYVCSVNKLYIVNLNLLSVKEYEVELGIKSIYVDEYIYLVGNKNDKPSILLLNQKGEFEKTMTYEGEGYAQFESIHKIEDKFLITGSKDAFFEHPDFLKVGNKNEIKSFLFIIDKTLQKIDEYYFNEYFEHETIISIGVDKNINIILQTEDNSFFYRFDKNLNLQEHIYLDDNFHYSYIPNLLDEVLLIRKELNQFAIGIYTNTFEPLYQVSFPLKNYSLYDGGIAFTYNNCLNIFSEYHINKNETFILSKLDYNIDSTNHLDISSYFEELSFNLDHFTPFHIYMINGEYQAIYRAVNKCGRTINIQTDVIVKDFVNIIDGGIYNVNTKLQFFGNATLNNENINNGYTLKETGQYELVLTNVNGLSKIYHFEVIDGYYKDNDHYVIDTDYILNPNEEIIIEYYLDDEYQVNHFIINNQEYSNFEQVGNKVLLKLSSSSHFNYEVFKIQSMVLEEANISLNESISLLTKKLSPLIDVYTISNHSLYEIHLAYQDKDDSFVDLCFIDQDNNRRRTYLKNSTLISNSASLVLQYELGDGVIQEEEIFSFIGEEVKLSVENQNEEIIIKVYPNKTIKSINVNNNNIYEKSNDNINLYILIISVGSSLVVILTTIFVLLLKKKIRKVNRI